LLRAISRLAIRSHKGIADLCLRTGGNPMPHRAVVQSAGLYFRLLLVRVRAQKVVQALDWPLAVRRVDEAR